MSTDTIDPLTNQPSTTFRTKDTAQAAFLWCRTGVKLLSVEGQGKTVFFSFHVPLDERDMTALVLSYANGETTVEPKLFVQKQNDLRDLIHGILKMPKRDTKEVRT
jgi:hypothetical protein